MTILTLSSWQGQAQIRATMESHMSKIITMDRNIMESQRDVVLLLKDAAFSGGKVATHKEAVFRTDVDLPSLNSPGVRKTSAQRLSENRVEKTKAGGTSLVRDVTEATVDVNSVVMTSAPSSRDTMPREKTRSRPDINAIEISSSLDNPSGGEVEQDSASSHVDTCLYDVLANMPSVSSFQSSTSQVLLPPANQAHAKKNCALESSRVAPESNASPPELGPKECSTKKQGVQAKAIQGERRNEAAHQHSLIESEPAVAKSFEMVDDEIQSAFFSDAVNVPITNLLLKGILLSSAAPCTSQE